MAAEQAQTTLPRWIYLFLGLLGSTTCGMLLYAWSVFIKPLNAEFGWTRSEIALAFAICCLVFGLMTFPAGRLSDKYGPRLVVVTGSIILCIGFVLSGFITSKIQLYITYGLIAGFGGGCIYLPPIATAPKWWPDRRALATGFAVVGLGLGSFLMGPLATKIINNPDMGWRYVFWYCGIAMGIMGVIAGLPLQPPPKGWKPAGWNPPAPAAGKKASRDFTHEESIRTPQFWMLYLSYFCGSFAGLMVIGHIAATGLDRGLTPMQAAGAISALAFANAATRIITGIVVDKIGVKAVFVVWFALQTAAMLLLFPAASTSWALWLCAALIGWNYGGMFTLFPAACLSYFGPTAQGSNYGLLFTAWGFAGFAGPWVGGYLKDTTGTYYMPFIIGSIVVAVSVIVSATLKAPVTKDLEEPAFAQK